jgi:hypothetical protein
VLKRPGPTIFRRQELIILPVSHYPSDDYDLMAV